ncbi:hypothetical protein MMC13_005596 [Lambiella insularis]|nr:hypothetical protein [Lambiella insularis]
MATGPGDAPIAIEQDLTADNYGSSADSAYDSEVASYTTSLASNVTDYKFEHGRRYHAYKEGAYIYPNDEKESDRLDIAHKMMDVAMNGKLYFAPLKGDPKRVLDLGTGTGIWAMEMGDMHPKSDILGNDLSPIQPRWVPPNVHFEVDDVEQEWTYSEKFDFIHCRTMGNAIQDWPRLTKQCFNFLKPGAWAEFVDFDLHWVSPDNTLPEGTAVLKIRDEFIGATRNAGMEPSPGPLLEGWLKDAGYSNISHQRLPLPVGTWPADKRLKELGAWNYLQCTEGLDAFVMAVFTRTLGYTREEVEVLVAKARKELKDPKMHCMFFLHVCNGQKKAEEE